MASVSDLKKIAKRLRIHSIKMTAASGTGHPTTCMSCAEIMSALFFSEMHYDIKNPHGYLNDEFVMSKGHAAPILWAAYAEAGILKEKDLLNLRKITCDLEGHPTPRVPWVKAATGSLGQGLSVAVGLALAMELDKLNRRVYCLLGDGECAEGNVWEAANSAANFKLSNLTAIVDVNRLGQSGATMHGHSLKIYAGKFKAFGWNTIIVDGHSIPKLLNAFKRARLSSKPTAIIAKTFKGHGFSKAENKNGWHGKPFTGEVLDKALKELGEMPKINSKKLVRKPFSKTKRPVYKKRTFADIEYPKDAQVATREAYGNALVMLGHSDKRVVAIDADVKNSTGEDLFFKEFSNRSFESYIAEQNMVGMGIGLAARGFIPFAATFACFLTRAHDQIRMAAYSLSNIKLCGSHVGVSIGPDGPSQMGLEDLAMFRPIPNCLIFYPSDAYSTIACTKLMAEHKGLAYLRTTRPKTPIIYKQSEKFRIGGSKVVRKSSKDKVTVVAAGITLHNALEAYEKLKKKGIFIRVIDAYSVKPIDKTTILKSLKETGHKLIVVEDHFPEGGLGEAVKSVIDDKVKFVHLAVRDLPRSGSQDELMEMFGISSQYIMKSVIKSIA